MTKKEKKALKNQNYLEFIPKQNPEIKTEKDDAVENGVMLVVENKGVFNKIAQKLFKRPKFSYIHLDKMGNFLWSNMDGKKTVYELAELLKNEFGEEADPLYPRIIKYFEIMKNYGFVCLDTK